MVARLKYMIRVLLYLLGETAGFFFELPNCSVLLPPFSLKVPAFLGPV